MRSHWRNKRNKIFALLGVILTIWALLILIPVDSFVIGPGSAADVSPLVRVGDIQPKEKGDFLLTTISVREARLLDLWVSRLTDRIELVPKEQMLAGDESEEEYERRQRENMRESQNHAIAAAFHAAEKPVSVRHEGVEVLGLLKNHASGIEVGDRIRRAEGSFVHSSDELVRLFSAHRPGDTVKLELNRGGRTVETEVRLVAIPASDGNGRRAGLGIIPMERVRVHTDPETAIHAGNIGGPSAGLMFSLEILDRLLPEDLTRGYRIAGTGTISDDGKVGQIGGIRHKLAAAADEGADIFLCPKDIKPGDSNEREAKRAAGKLGGGIRVVPVSTLGEAVRFLRSLPPRDQVSFKSKTLTDLIG
ncbi:SepM family pheromone-processing serine protease [Staphylospora marina]|uniref:SepM family pheromone-processing serine protease n=1 Tax=Staphylospora marina TaxID=2490858 RepID=UPI0013DD9DCC|nr:SepM family pheromone-processing serine protease [Staphylospora marina]